jgi:transposase
MLVTRIAKLALVSNSGKREGAAYTYGRHLKFTQHWVTQLYFNRAVKSFSTAGMGQLSNQAQHKAQGILKAHFESVKETGSKSNVPQVKQIGCPAKIEKSEKSSFDYWLSVENTFEKSKKIWVPVKGHKRLTHWLKQGYELNPTAELHKDKNGKFYAIVFVQKEVEKATPKENTLGVDVGVTHSVSRSDGYLGLGCKKLLTRNRDRNAERRRQGHLKKSVKTFTRQRLDIEAKRAVRVAQARGLNLAFEDPKLLANLKPRGRIAMWAKSYFANRASVLAQERGVFVVKVFPPKTSQTCAQCQHCDSESRVKSVFKCTACGNRTHADINAGRVIARKGSENVARILAYRSGSALKRPRRAGRAA